MDSNTSAKVIGNTSLGRGLRWSALLLASLVMMMGYVFWDIVSPVSSMLKASIADGGMAWTSTEYGFYAGSYSIFNIFFLMLFFGGIILDKCGIRLTGLLATGSMLAGAIINYYAIVSISPLDVIHPWITIFGFIPSPLKTQVLVSSLGFALFGMGCDITGITVSKIITKWFTGHGLASAMGIQVALARLGTASALSFSPLIAQSFGVSASVLAGVGVLLLAFVLFIIYCGMDKKCPTEATSGSSPLSSSKKVLDDNIEEHTAATLQTKNEGVASFSWAFVLIIFLCVFFYSSIRPFMKFATDLLVNDFGVENELAGWIVAAIPYGTIVLTPLFGVINDKFKCGEFLMVIGCAVVCISHLLLAFPLSHSAYYSLVIMVFEGVAFSLVPSALWPQVPKIVPLKKLGTAYSIIYFVQNIGLMLVPVWIGHVVDAHTAANGHIDYTVPMIIFMILGAAALLCSCLLLRATKTKSY